MPKKARSKKAMDRLPNAPLNEVVFELRWRLRGNSPFFTDPGLLPLSVAFTSRAPKLGFPVHKDMAKPEEVFGHSVTRRFYPAADATFPILQIGSGVFASNQSSEYSWKTFLTQTLKGLAAFLDSYPKLEGYPFEPVYLELRYIDVFDVSLIGTLDLIKFANVGTALNVEVPDKLFDKRFSEDTEGRLLIAKTMKNGSKFIIDLASARKDTIGQPALRLETKVTTLDAQVPKYRNNPGFVKAVDKWLHDAHDVTSPFFKSFISPEIMKKFS